MNEVGLSLKDAPVNVATDSQPLAAKLQDHVRQTGTLSSADIASFARTPTEPAGPQPGAAMHEDTPVDQPKDAVEPLVAAATSGESASVKLSDLQEVISESVKAQKQQEELKRKIIVTAEDKDAFVTALISDARLELTIHRCGGKVSAVIRSRTVPESQAILAYMQRQILAGKAVSQVDYITQIRAAMLAAQLKHFNGKDFKPLAEPLVPVNDTATKTTIPAAWEGSVDYFMKMDEAPFAILWACVEEFEAKYWRMIEDAKDQNFWNPAASI